MFVTMYGIKNCNTVSRARGWLDDMDGLLLMGFKPERYAGALRATP